MHVFLVSVLRSTPNRAPLRYKHVFKMIKERLVHLSCVEVPLWCNEKFEGLVLYGRQAHMHSVPHRAKFCDTHKRGGCTLMFRYID